MRAAQDAHDRCKVKRLAPTADNASLTPSNCLGFNTSCHAQTGVSKLLITRLQTPPTRRPICHAVVLGYGRKGIQTPKEQAAIRIVDIREVALPIASPIANAYIDFSRMTCSLVAVVTDVIREGKTVVGYGFNSNGRYGQGGLIRERFAPRLREADPTSLLNESDDNLDPDRAWRTLMHNEKPGGHGERSVAAGTIDMAVWDAVAKIAGKPLLRLLAERYGCVADPRLRLRCLLLPWQESRSIAR